MNDLEKESGGKVTAEIRNATDPVIKARITTEYGFTSHGLVFYTPEGDSVIKVMDGHDMRRPAIEGAMKEVLAGD